MLPLCFLMLPLATLLWEILSFTIAVNTLCFSSVAGADVHMCALFMGVLTLLISSFGMHGTLCPPRNAAMPIVYGLASSIFLGGVKSSDINEIILVGGVARMPKVVETVKTSLSCELSKNVKPNEAVAIGASQGGILTGNVTNILLVDESCPYYLVCHPV